MEVTKLNKVLILSFYFPPDNAIGGQRPYAFAKYLSDYNWTPIVITANKNIENDRSEIDYDFQIFDTKYIDPANKYKKLMGKDPQDNIVDSNSISKKNDKSLEIYKYIRDFLLYPDRAKGWNEKHIFDIISDILKKEKIKFIISTGPPQSSHILAYKIYKKFDIPYILDFRDLWYLNPYRYENNIILKYLDKIIEKKVVDSSNAIITVSKTWSNWLKKCYPNKKINCIRNGYDLEEFSKLNKKAKPENKKPPIIITYAGSLYDGKRNIEPLFQALKSLKEKKYFKKNELKFVFFGSEINLVVELVNKYSLEMNVEIKGYKNRNVVLNYLNNKTDILLFLNWDNKKEKGTIAGKLYEYFAINKPILGIGYKFGEASDLINKYSQGEFFSSSEVLGIEDYLKKWLNKENGIELEQNDLSKYVKQFDRKKQVKKLSIFLNKLLNK